MKSILPPDGSPITVTSGSFTNGGHEQRGVLVMIEVTGGPIITLTPREWACLVNRIRGARTARELGA